MGGGGFGGLSGLGGSIYSDIRLKTNIKRIGTYAKGFGKYTWDYIWGESGQGAMAHEVEKVMPDAVKTVHGFKTVNYAMIGD